MTHRSILVTGPLAVLGLAVAALAPLADRAAAREKGGGELARFSFAARATVVRAEPGGSERRATYEYRVLVDGARHCLDMRSDGGDVGLLPRFATCYDGVRTATLLPGTDTVTMRTGEIREPLPLPIPDPLSLQVRALLALEGGPGAGAINARDVGRDPDLRARLLRAARERQAGARQGERTEVRTSAGEAIAVTWKELGGRRVPSAFERRGAPGAAAWTAWEVEEFFPVSETAGVAGVPRSLVLQAGDPRWPGAEMRVRWEVLSFDLAPRIDPESFRLDAPAFARVWDDDVHAFVDR